MFDLLQRRELQVLPSRLDLQQRFIKGGRRAAAVRKANNERELAGKYDPRDERVDCPLLLPLSSKN